MHASISAEFALHGSIECELQFMPIQYLCEGIADAHSAIWRLSVEISLECSTYADRRIAKEGGHAAR